jgi:hypothetical protein
MILRDYVDQTRTGVIGPCEFGTGGFGMMVYDYRYNQMFCVPILQERTARSEVDSHG